MYLANKFSRFVTNSLNDALANSNVSFKYLFLPISHYNVGSYVDSTFKLVGSGYSALMPALAFGLTQKDLVNIKDLENDVLKIGDRLRPLSTSYTQSASGKSGDGAEENGEAGAQKSPQKSGDEDEGGRPKKKEEEKADKTIQNEESLDRTGGGS